MKVTSEDLGNRQVLLTIEVDEERVERSLRSVARRISRQYSIPGFRRGRAPYHIILQRFGREALLQETLDELTQQIYQESLESEELEPYRVGSLEDLQLDPLVLKMRVPLRPVVDLGDYRELRVEPQVVTVAEEDIDAELEKLRQTNVVLEPADDRPANMGDMVSFDVRAEVNGESYVRQEGYSMVLDARDDTFAPGFCEQIVGMEVGEEKSFTLSLSDEETEEGDESEDATFNVTLHEVRNRALPGLDDDLARTVGDFDTLEELRQAISARLGEEAQRQADHAYTEEVIEALIERATLEYPPDLINDHVDDVVEGVESRLESQGLELDDYFKLSGQTEETFRESVRPRAEQSARRGLVMGELAHQEKLKVEADEVDAYIASVTSAWGEQADELRQTLYSPDNMRSVANNLLADKAIQRLLAIARGEAPPLEQAEQEPEEKVAEGPEGAQDIAQAESVETVEAETVEVEADRVETAQVEETPGVQAAPEQEEAEEDQV